MVNFKALYHSSLSVFHNQPVERESTAKIPSQEITKMAKICSSFISSDGLAQYGVNLSHKKPAFYSDFDI